MSEKSVRLLLGNKPAALAWSTGEPEGVVTRTRVAPPGYPSEVVLLEPERGRSSSCDAQKASERVGEEVDIATEITGSLSTG